MAFDWTGAQSILAAYLNTANTGAVYSSGYAFSVLRPSVTGGMNVLYETAAGTFSDPITLAAPVPFTTSVSIPIESATKLITCMIALAMVDAGQLNLDSTVHDLFVSVGNPDNWPAGGAVANNGYVVPNVSMRAMLCHAACMPSVYAQPLAIIPGYANLGSPRRTDLPNGLADCMGLYLGTVGSPLTGSFSLQFPQPVPGTTGAPAQGSYYSYESGGYQVFARYASLKMGVEFDSVFRTLIANPLGFASGVTYGTIATGVTNPQAGGGLYCSLDDYNKAVQCILNGGILNGTRILQASSVAQINVNYMGAGQPFAGAVPGILPPPGYWNRDIGFSLGSFVEDPTVIEPHALVSGLYFSDVGALGATVRFIPAINAAIVMWVANGSPMAGVNMVDAVTPEVIRQIQANP